MQIYCVLKFPNFCGKKDIKAFNEVQEYIFEYFQFCRVVFSLVNSNIRNYVKK